MNEIQIRLGILAKQGWTKKAIADELDVTSQAIRYWENGERYPGTAGAVLLALDALAQKKAPPKRRYPQGHYLQRRKAEQEKQ